MRYALQSIVNIIPSVPIPSAINPAAELIFNRNFYTGSTVLGMYEKQTIDSLQYRPQTREIAKVLANFLSNMRGVFKVNQQLGAEKEYLLSPIHIDYLLGAYATGVMQYTFYIVLIITWLSASLLLNIYILNIQNITESLMYLLRFSAYISLFPIFLSESSQNKFYYENLIYISSITLFILGILQMKYFPSFKELNMTDFGWDPHEGRLLSTWFDPNYIGALFAFIPSVILGKTIDQYEKTKTINKYYILILTTNTIGLILTYSRSSLLFLVSSICIFLIFKSRKLLITFILICIITLSLSPRLQERSLKAYKTAKTIIGIEKTQIDPTSQLRIESWENGAAIIKNNLLTGIGFNTLKEEQKKYTPPSEGSHHSLSGIDSSLLTFFATSGLLGIILILYAYAYILTQCISSLKKTKKTIYLGIFSALIGLLVHSIFVNTLMLNLFLPFLMFFAATAITRKKNKLI